MVRCNFEGQCMKCRYCLRPKSLCIVFEDIEANNLENRDSNYEHGPITPVELDDDKITLEIPDEPVCGWKMDELNSFQVRFNLVYYI